MMRKIMSAILVSIMCVTLSGCSPLGDSQIDTVKNMKYKDTKGNVETLEDLLDENFDDVEWDTWVSPINGMTYVKFSGKDNTNDDEWHILFFALTSSNSDNDLIRNIENELDINQVLFSYKMTSVVINGREYAGFEGESKFDYAIRTES